MKRRKLKDNMAERRSARTAFWVVIVAAVTLEATSLIQTYYAQKNLKEQASLRAQTQLEYTRLNILDIIDQAESAVRNSIWIAHWCLNFQDSLPRVTYRVVKDNPVVMGSTVALVPGYSKRYPLFAPYTCRVQDSLVRRSLATEEYDYPSREWFTKPIELDDGYWSEPYIDTGGGDVLMTTYSVPIKEKQDRTAAVLTADIALDWLIDMIGDIKIYPHATTVMISRSGQFMMSRDREMMKSTLIDIVDSMRSNRDFQKPDQAMKPGQSGSTTLKYDGDEYHVFYAPIVQTGWAMCIIVPSEDIYGSIRQMGLWVLLFQVLGLALLIIILNTYFKNQKKFNALNEKKERLQGELRIASNIQMSMVPKTFPPFPDRHDLDLSASIVPAKEVGGDLYDFYIRDERLFYCIGDVSGKGVPASLVMAITRTLFRNVSSHQNSPMKIVTAMNDSMSEMNESNMFVTFFCGVLDLHNGKMHYCNAGHNAPLILTDDIQVLPVEPNLPLGIMKGMQFVEQEVQLNYDDAIFLYTDGLTEAENINHELFGEERMKMALHERRSAQGHMEAVQAAVSDFVGDAPQSDDLTMLFLHYIRPGEEGSSERHLTLHNDINQIPQLATLIESIAREKQLDQALAMSLNLALEEAVTNVILYAYPPKIDGTVDIDATIRKDSLQFVITDKGSPFDPTVVPEADTTLGVEDRPIGGLGIYLVRKLMDSVEYEYTDGKNILTLTKKLL